MEETKKILLKVLPYLLIIAALFAGYWWGYGIGKGDGPPVPEPKKAKTGIEILRDRIRVTIMPTPDDAGKFIIKPRCSNVGLKLTCGKDSQNRQVRFNTANALGRGLGIGCPDDGTYPSDWGADYIDVVKLPDNPDDIEPFFVECDLSKIFDLTAPELGIGDPENVAGKFANCTIEGEFDTTGVSDPATLADLDDEYAQFQWCLDEEGKVPLSGITQSIEAEKLHFFFPREPLPGMWMRRGPWMYSGHAPEAPGPPDWSFASKQPAPPDGRVVGGTDDDGFTDWSENNGYLFANQLTLSAGTYPGHAPTYIGTCGPSDPRPFCVNSLDQEVFTIMEPLPSSSIFPDASSVADLAWFFENIASSSTSGGLSIDIHALSQPHLADTPQLYRRVNDAAADSQTAIRIIEDDSDLSSGSDKGDSDTGVPNQAGVVRVYTVRIRQDICNICGGDWDSNASECTNLPNGGADCKSTPSQVEGTAQDGSLYREYAKYVVHHEIGHSLNLVVTTPNDNWHHVSGEDSWYMMGGANYSKKGKKVTFYLPYEYCSACQSNRDLTENNP